MYEQEQRIILHKPAGQRDRQLGTFSSVLLMGRASITTSATSAGTPVMRRKKLAREMTAFIMDAPPLTETRFEVSLHRKHMANYGHMANSRFLIVLGKKTVAS